MKILNLLRKPVIFTIFYGLDFCALSNLFERVAPPPQPTFFLLSLEGALLHHCALV